MIDKTICHVPQMISVPVPLCVASWRDVLHSCNVFLQFKVVVGGMLPFLQFVTSQHGRRLIASLNYYGMKLLLICENCKFNTVKI